MPKMPNNVSILAYIQCIKDRTIEAIKNIEKMQKFGNKDHNSIPYRSHLRDIENLEKFIKGGK
jgi:hypothetical protein